METESNQKAPEMVIGYVRPRGLQIEIFASLVEYAVEKVNFT